LLRHARQTTHVSQSASAAIACQPTL
jgi:hypothetical protein